jgi:hypothetical protein
MSGSQRRRVRGSIAFHELRKDGTRNDSETSAGNFGSSLLLRLGG